ncbi:Uncharacterised protein [Clostridioides difficile]|uniref:hypothetical protein n=1 Tax=Clostridioides difficile TaxID=1496 RepID=UPI00098004B1|nr:hypothetical protein [Clostridioides difficile]SJP68443.1 Uncharacterised protein [Clostridioides difficile]
MAKLSVNIGDRNKLKALGLDDITLESIERALEQRGSIDIPIDVLVILRDMRCPNNKYGAYSSKKMLLEWSGINSEHKDDINNIIGYYERSKGLLYMDIFNGLDTKTFEAYVEALNGVIKDDIDMLVDKIVSKCNICKSLAKDFLNVYMALRTYNGFIMEYLITQMLLISDRYDVLEQLNINDGVISSRALDKDYGIDILAIPLDVTDVNIPLQLKAQTNFRVRRDKLQKTFDNHKDFKRLYDNIIDKEAKGNVYYLHYDMSSLRVALIQNREFTYALPMSRELEHTIIANPIFKYVEVWDIVEILDRLVEDICYNILDDVEDVEDTEDYVADNVPKMAFKEPNIDFIRFYRNIDISKIF